MNAKQTGVLLLSLLILGVVNTASGAVAFQDPATASWGGWDRGDDGTSHGHWSVITDDLGGTAFDSDSLPDFGNFNNKAAMLFAHNDGAFVTGGGLGGNVYSFTDTPSFSLYVVPDYKLPSSPVTFALQVKVLGTLVDFNSVNLNGVAWDTSETLFTGDAGGPWGGADEEYLFVWHNVAASEAYAVDFMALGPHMSLDEVAFDVAVVPLPPAVFMFGTALLGLIGLRRKAKK